MSNAPWAELKHERHRIKKYLIQKGQYISLGCVRNYKDSVHPVALSGQGRDIVRYPYPSTESGDNTSLFHGLHIAQQNENGIRYNLGHCRLDRRETAKTPFVPTY